MITDSRLTDEQIDRLPLCLREGGIECLVPRRNPRVTRIDADVACVEIDDDGYGPGEIVCTHAQADILVAAGICRDDRAQ